MRVTGRHASRREHRASCLPRLEKNRTDVCVALDRDSAAKLKYGRIDDVAGA